MNFISTRNNKEKVSFYRAITDCIPPDGGLYVPDNPTDLRPWIKLLDEFTSFETIAGNFTSSFLMEEFSPVVCERIAALAYGAYSPRLKQLDEQLFVLELFHGPTGCHRDFSFLWLASVLEHVLTMNDEYAVVLATGTKKNGRSTAAAFGNKKRIKTVLIHPKGCAKGISEEHLAENGGSVYSVEIEGNLAEAESLIRSIYADRDLVKNYRLTIANTVNIGVVLPKIFFYAFAFSRLKKLKTGEIYYALHSGNYGNLSAGIYSWKNSLFLNGFITDSTSQLCVDTLGLCLCKAAELPLEARNAADPVSPSNIERLEQIFNLSPEVMKALIFPQKVDKNTYRYLAKQVYRQYGIMLDSSSVAAYASILKSGMLKHGGKEAFVLIAKDQPAFESDFVIEACKEYPIIPSHMKNLDEPIKKVYSVKGTKEEIKNILEKIER